MKKLLLIDMDGVLADFEQNVENIFKKEPALEYVYRPKDSTTFPRIDLIPDVFRDPPVIKGAIEGIKRLQDSGLFEMVVVTTAPWSHSTADSDKKFWLKKHFGDLFKKNMITTHRKDLVMGHYIVDDRIANGVENFIGEHIHFGTQKFPDWGSTVDYLIQKETNEQESI